MHTCVHVPMCMPMCACTHECTCVYACVYVCALVCVCNRRKMICPKWLPHSTMITPVCDLTDRSLLVQACEKVASGPYC